MKNVFEYNRKSVSSSYSRLYDMILSCWVQQKKEVLLDRGHLNLGVDYNDIIWRVALDHPEIFWIDYYKYYRRESIFGTTLVFQYYCNQKERIAMEQEVGEWREYICSFLSSAMSKREMLWMLYDYLSRQVSYGERGHLFSHTLLGCVPCYGHIAVCEGIAKAYKYLCDGADLQCGIIPGYLMTNQSNTQSVSHAWNVVQWNERQFYIDITQAVANKNYPTTSDYFLMDESSMQGYIWA